MKARATGLPGVAVCLLAASLSTGCRSFYEVSLTRRAVEEASLAEETVRVSTGEGQKVLRVLVVFLPPDSEDLAGGYLEGPIKGQLDGQSTRFYFDDLQKLEVSRLSFWKNTGVVLAGVGATGAVLAVAALIAVATVAASL